jgi:thiamine pyrophosphokinase
MKNEEDETMSRCVILGGADIHNYKTVASYLRPDDYYICCDSGLKHRAELGVQPDLIVGDFDSHENPMLDSVETIVLPREKDDTDTAYAVKKALAAGFDDFLLLGVVGGRLDHTLGNISLLLMLDSRGAHAVAVDDYSEMEIVSRQPAYVTDRYAYFSLLNISGLARGITVQNAKYPLTDAEITCEYPYGISNEPLPGQTAKITVETGRMLLIRVWPT